MLGFSLMGMSTVETTPVAIGDITSVSIQRAIYDTFRVDNDVISSGDKLFDMDNVDWYNDTTELYAQFNGNLYAGNSDFGVDSVTNILIKRREVGEFEWFNMFDVKVDSVEDFNFVVVDRYAKAGVKYQYAFVPIINGLESEYSIATCEATNEDYVVCNFEGVIVMDKDTMYNTILDISTNTQKNHSKSYVTTLNNRYPFVVKNSINNYYTGSISATYLHFIGYDYDKEGSRKYREEFLDFLVNDNTKIIKIYDGRTFLCEIVDAISDANDEHHEVHAIQYNFIEVGDIESNKDMHNGGFLDISEEWW